MSTEKWDTADIAEYHGYSRAHVTDKLIKRPDFPVPFINTSRKHRFWDRAVIEAWAAGTQRREAISSELAL